MLLGATSPNSLLLSKLAASEHSKLQKVPIEFDYSSLHSPSVKGKSATPHLPIQNISPMRKPLQ